MEHGWGTLSDAARHGARRPARSGAARLPRQPRVAAACPSRRGRAAHGHRRPAPGCAVPAPEAAAPQPVPKAKAPSAGSAAAAATARRHLQPGRRPDLRGLHFRAVGRAARGAARAHPGLHHAGRRQRPRPPARRQADPAAQAIGQVRSGPRAAGPRRLRRGRRRSGLQEAEEARSQAARRGRAGTDRAGSPGADDAGRPSLWRSPTRSRCRSGTARPTSISSPSSSTAISAS